MILLMTTKRRWDIAVRKSPETSREFRVVGDRGNQRLPNPEKHLRLLEFMKRELAKVRRTYADGKKRVSKTELVELFIEAEKRGDGITGIRDIHKRLVERFGLEVPFDKTFEIRIRKALSDISKFFVRKFGNELVRLQSNGILVTNDEFVLPDTSILGSLDRITEVLPEGTLIAIMQIKVTASNDKMDVPIDKSWIGKKAIIIIVDD